MSSHHYANGSMSFNSMGVPNFWNEDSEEEEDDLSPSHTVTTSNKRTVLGTWAEASSPTPTSSENSVMTKKPPKISPKVTPMALPMANDSPTASRSPRNQRIHEKGGSRRLTSNSPTASRSPNSARAMATFSPTANRSPSNTMNNTNLGTNLPNKNSVRITSPDTSSSTKTPTSDQRKTTTTSISNNGYGLTYLMDIRPDGSWDVNRTPTFSTSSKFSPSQAKSLESLKSPQSLKTLQSPISSPSPQSTPHSLPKSNRKKSSTTGHIYNLNGSNGKHKNEVYSWEPKWDRVSWPHNNGGSTVASISPSTGTNTVLNPTSNGPSSTPKSASSIVPRGSIASSKKHDKSNDEEILKEMGENDLFALEVGLMFSADEGDQITSVHSSICASLTLDSDTLNSQSIPNYPSVPQAHHDDDGDSTDDYNYIRNPKYFVHSQPSAPLMDPLGSPVAGTPRSQDEPSITPSLYSGSQTTVRDDHGNKIPQNAKMILGTPHVHHHHHHHHDKNLFPTILSDEQRMEKRLRELAGTLRADWRGSQYMPPALARRLRDFQFAREKRRRKYGSVKMWGILGLYDHLAGVRIDVEWAEDAAWRRNHGEPYLTWADFEAMKNSGFNRPFFTFFIVSTCTAMMFASILANDWKFEPLSTNPMIGPSAETLLRLGAKDSFLIVRQSEVWRLVSPMVLHAGLIHFGLNMFALWYVGKAVEQIHGMIPSLVQFVVPAVGGTILSAIFLPEYITVGASGGIFGLIGACISDIVMNWNLLFNDFVNERGTKFSHAKVLVVLFLDVVVNCLIGLTPFVDNFTHLGGMILGFLCGLSTIQLVSPRFFGDGRHYLYHLKIFFFRSFGLLVSMAGIVASLIVLFSGDGQSSPCSACTALSCISMPPWTAKNDKWWYCDDCSMATAEGTLDSETGKFEALDINCPNGIIASVRLSQDLPQDEDGLEGLLPMLCREHCLWR